MRRFSGVLLIALWIARAVSQSEELDFDIKEALSGQGVNASYLFEHHLMERPFDSPCATAVCLISEVGFHY